MKSSTTFRTPCGHYSPLRYPGGKGKIAAFIKELVRENGVSDGRYIEPYAGGAAIAWELLITGVVRRVVINDISGPVHAFWSSVLNKTEALCELIERTPITLQEWDRQKLIYKLGNDTEELELGFAFFFLNRTNRSGILNGGIIGGRAQEGAWKIDARFNKADLVSRIRAIAARRSKIELFRMDALELLRQHGASWGPRALVYLDPPYYQKGHYLYHDSYGPGDHAAIAAEVMNLRGLKWIVSYDDIRPIHDLYEQAPWLQYTLNYSARNAVRGRESMFFSEGLKVPDLPSPLLELDRNTEAERRPLAARSFLDTSPDTKIMT
jgi:DNA adenine methylase